MGIQIKQHDITDCGAACLASIAAYYKLKLPIARIRQMAGTNKKGTNLLGMIRAAQKLGFSAKGVRGKLDALIDVPLPAIAHVILDNHLHHYVVLYKVKKDQVWIMDPGIGKTQRVAISKWKEQWTGVLMLIAPDESFKSGNYKTSVFVRFWSLLKPHKSVLIQALSGAILYTILGLSTSIYIQKITDYVLIDGNTNLLNLLSLLMIGLLLVQVFIGFMKSIIVLKTGQRIDAQLILGYYKHLLKLPQSFFDTMRVGEILSRIGDAVKIRAFINDVSISLFVNAFIVVFSFGLMFAYHWRLALIMCAVLPLYLLIYIVTNHLNKRRERDVMEKAADLENQLVESLKSMKTLKQFGLESSTYLKTEDRFVRILGATYQSGLNSLFSTNASELLSRLFTIFLLWSGSYFVLDRSITPGELLSFYALVGYFTGPAMSLIGMNKTIQNALIAADRLFEIIDLELEEVGQKFNLTRQLVGDVHFKQVSFGYNNRNVLFKELSFRLPKGRITAIVGESGSGKSTVASLLQKIYPVQEGMITIGEYNLQYLSNESLRRLIGVVPQQLDLFSGTIIDNIALGDPNPNLKRVLDISTDLGLTGFIEKLPNGFDQQLGDNGLNLSGGQRQRLAIARALYRDPEILILDEATSSLDSSSEVFVQSVVQKLKDEGKTILIIAHRMSAVQFADNIIVLKNGQIVEEGKHQSLVRLKGVYYSYWTRQFPAFSADSLTSTSA